MNAKFDKYFDYENFSLNKRVNKRENFSISQYEDQQSFLGSNKQLHDVDLTTNLRIDT